MPRTQGPFLCSQVPLDRAVGPEGAKAEVSCQRTDFGKEKRELRSQNQNDPKITYSHQRARTISKKINKQQAK